MTVTGVERVLARVRRAGLDDLPLASLAEQLCGELGHRWRDRLLTPIVTVRLFVLQQVGWALPTLFVSAGGGGGRCPPYLLYA